MFHTVNYIVCDTSNTNLSQGALISLCIAYFSNDSKSKNKSKNKSKIEHETNCIFALMGDALTNAISAKLGTD